MSKLEQAKKLILNYNFPKELKEYAKEEEGTYAEENIRGWYFDGVASMPFMEMTPKVLADSFHYYIDIETEDKEEKDIPLGSSKLHGLPHLPKSIEWPEEYYFYAQINFEELKKHDIENLFPSKGILYLFFDGKEGEEGSKAIYYTGDLKELEIRDYPNVINKHTDKYLLDEFKNNASLITFSPKLIFYVGSEYGEVLEIIPADLKKEIEKLISVDITDQDSSIRILGRPMYWQGEDEFFGDEEEEDTMEEDDDEYYGFPQSREDHLPYKNILLFHDGFAEGNIHFWIDKEALKKENFDEIEVTYSGT